MQFDEVAKKEFHNCTVECVPVSHGVAIRMTMVVTGDRDLNTAERDAILEAFGRLKLSIKFTSAKPPRVVIRTRE